MTQLASSGRAITAVGVVKKTTGPRLVLICELDITSSTIQRPEQVEITTLDGNSSETALATSWKLETR